MKQKLCIAFFIAPLLLFAFKAGKEITFKLGDASCKLLSEIRPHSIATLIALHDNENTCVESFNSLSKEIGFSLFEIHQDGNRLLAYKEKNKLFYFDPNRIFSLAGIEKTLKKNNQHYPKSLVVKINSFAGRLLTKIFNTSPTKYYIAIHNNTEGNFSVYSYENSKDAEKVFVSDGEDPDDFFMVTNVKDFEHLRNLHQNVVLQSGTAPDDGSLSFYCQRNNISFITVEAQHGHRLKQMEMLTLTYNLLSKK